MPKPFHPAKGRPVARGARQRSRGFASDRRGNIAVMGAVIMMPLTMLGGGATDYARMRQTQSEVQDALDAAMRAARRARVAARAARLKTVFAGAGPKDVPWPAPTVTTNADGTLTASVTVNSPNAFLTVAAIPTLPAHASTTGSPGAGANTVCITTMAPSVTGFVRTGGSALGVAGDAGAKSGCTFDVRSTATPAMKIEGAGSFSVTRICVRGGTVTKSGMGSMTYEAGCTLAQPYTAKVIVPSRLNDACLFTNHTFSGNATLNPGVYCGGITFAGAGTIRFNAGDYVFKAAPNGQASSINLTGNQELFAEGVSFYWADGGYINDNGAQNRTWTAPTSTRFKGILFQEPVRPTSGSFVFDVGVKTRYEGVINLPSRDVEAKQVSTAPGQMADKVTMVVRTFTMGAASGTWRIEPAAPSAADESVAWLKG